MGRRGVFLDLNDTLVEPLKPSGVVEAVARLSAGGFVCPVVTVQSRIAKGLFSLPKFEIWFASFAGSLQMQGRSWWGRMCALIAFADPCPCKKRIPYFTIVRQLNINLSRQIVL
jgi:histidinol phosphatase-like enzyme